MSEVQAPPAPVEQFPRRRRPTTMEGARSTIAAATQAEAERARRAEQEPASFKLEHHLQRGIAIVVRGGGLVKLASAARERRSQAWVEGRSAAVHASRDSEAHQRVARLRSQIADAESLVAKAKAQKGQAQQDARHALTVGASPEPAEKRLRQAELDVGVYEARLPVLRELLPPAEREAESVEKAAADAFAEASQRELKADRESLHAELLPQLQAWLEKAIGTLDVATAEAPR